MLEPPELSLVSRSTLEVVEETDAQSHQGKTC